MAAGQKKVIVRPLSGEPIAGYLPAGSLFYAGEASLLDPSGKVIPFRLNDIKTIAYVRDFNLQDLVDPERLGRRAFAARPRADGLWLRLTFRDGEVLEGMAAADMSLLDVLVEDGGLFVVPPDARSNTQRLFVPRMALAGIEMLGLVRPALPKKTGSGKSAEAQPGLFED